MLEVLICQREACHRGVYLCLPAAGRSSFTSYWYCYAGHEQDPNQLAYAPLSQVDTSTPDDARHWSEYPTLNRSFVAIEDLCLQAGFDQDELDTSDWRIVTCDYRPNWMDTHPCQEEPEAWRTHHEHYETYHVYIGGRAFFFWIRNDVDVDAAYASVPYFWQEDNEGERRNTDIFIIRNGQGQILHRMASTHPGAIQERLASAYAILRGNPLYDRVEVHKNTFDPTNTYTGKPLAVVTRDDLRG
jgi:hypothetical protein